MPYYTPSGMSIEDAERLSAAQQAAQGANQPQEGEAFLMDIGEGGRALAVRRNGQIYRLGFNFPTDWQGRTIGNWQNQYTQQYAGQLGIDLSQLNYAGGSNENPNQTLSFSDLGGGGQTITDINQFRGMMTPGARTSSLQNVPTAEGMGISYQTPSGRSAAITGEQVNPEQPSQVSPATATSQPSSRIEELIARAQAQGAQGIPDLLRSNREFNETDAKNFAYFMGEGNWQKYIGGAAGEPNPLYIGSTNWKNLQNVYTPYQLRQATTQNQYGIYWNPQMSISEIPRQDPSETLNQENEQIFNMVNNARSEADLTLRSDYQSDQSGSTDTPQSNMDQLMQLLTSQYNSSSAEEIYNQLYNTPEMRNAMNDVTQFDNELKSYDDQLEELEGDIRNEVSGEAPASYISALAAVRGGDILKLKRIAQRGYDTALANMNNLKEQAANLLTVRLRDNDNRYNRLFDMLQLQLTQEGREFDQQMALTNIGMQLPKGRSITLPDGSVVHGLNENENLNVIQFTDSNHNVYVIGVDKTTGKEIYRSLIGRAPSGGGSEFSYAKQLSERQAQMQIGILDKIESGDYAIGEKDGETFYYDKKAYDEATSADQGFQFGDLAWWNQPDPYDFRIQYGQ